jgi:DNA primase
VLENASAQPAIEEQADGQELDDEAEGTAHELGGGETVAVNGAGSAGGDLLLAAQAAVAQPPAPSLPARPTPGAAGPLVELAGDELHVQVDGRRWRVRGLGKASSFEALRVNVLVAREHPAPWRRCFTSIRLTLYSARARGVFARQAGEELGLAEELIARDLGRVLLACEQQSEAAVRFCAGPRASSKSS